MSLFLSYHEVAITHATNELLEEVLGLQEQGNHQLHEAVQKMDTGNELPEIV